MNLIKKIFVFFLLSAKMIFATSGELLTDPGFEAFGTGWNFPAGCSITGVGVHAGARAYRITNTDSAVNILAAKRVTNGVQGVKDYTFSYWVYAQAGVGNGPAIKAEFYNSSGIYIGEIASPNLTAAQYGVWTLLSAKGRAPAGTAWIQLAIRLRGSGSVNYDDGSLKYDDPIAFDLTTNPRVAYVSPSSILNGVFSLQFNFDSVTNLVGAKSFLEIRDRNSALVFSAGPLAPTTLTQAINFTVPGNVAGLYTLKASVYDAANVLLHTSNDLMTVVRAPNTLSNGHFTTNGAAFFPIGIYHGNPADFPQLKAAGFNAVQSSGNFGVSEQTTSLDAAQAAGLKYAMALYSDLNTYKELTVRSNMAMASSIMRTLRNHPALYTYWFMDEPDVWKVPMQDIVELRYAKETNDWRHANSMVLAPFSVNFSAQQQACDVISIDPYPKTASPRPFWVRDQMVMANQMNKPIVTVVQAFEALPTWIKPTPAELNNYVYQALIHGAIGVYYYALDDAAGWDLRSTDLWTNAIRLNAEMKTLAPVLLNPVMMLATKNAPTNASVDYASAFINGTNWILAINVTTTPKVFTLTGLSGKLNAMFGRGVTNLISGNTLSETIEGYGSRVWYLDPIVSTVPPVVSIFPSAITTNQSFSAVLGVDKNFGFWSTNGMAGPYVSFSVSGTNVSISKTTTLWYYGSTNGVASATNSMVYTFDITPPVVTGVPAGFTTNSSFSISVGVTENFGYVSTNGLSGPYSAFTVSGTNLTFNQSATLWYFGRDALGNASATNSATFTVNLPSPPPAVSVFPSAITTNQSFSAVLGVDKNFGFWSTNGMAGPYVSFSFSVSGTNVSISKTTTLWYYGSTNGVTSATNSVVYTFDTTPPVVTGVPAGFTTNSSFSINVGVTENFGYVSTNGLSGPYSAFTVSGTNLTFNQSGTLWYFGRDALGNASATNSATFTINLPSPPPVVSVFPSAITTNQSFNSVLGVDKNFGFWSTNGMAGPYVSFSISGTNVSISKTTTLWYYGSTNGVTSATNSVVYTFDTTPPVVTGVPAGFTTNSSFSINVGVTENFGYVSTNGLSGPYSAFTVSGTNLTFNQSGTLWYFGRDALGNASATNSATFTVEPSLPMSLENAVAVGSPYDGNGPGIVFARLTPAVSLKIYSISGKFVWEKMSRGESKTGTLLWPVTQAASGKVPAGTYVCVLSNPVGQKKIIKVQVLP